MPSFDPQQDIPDLSDKVCLVTGATSGLGEAAVTELAQHNPKVLYLGARSHEKAEATISRIRASSIAAKTANIEILELDLASLESVKAAAARVNTEVDRLDLLQLVAGVGLSLADTTKDGYEVQFGTNYVGHALLTQLLMPKLLRTATLPHTDVRVVSLTSITHKTFAPATGILFDELKTDMKTHGGFELYAQSMLAKVLFTRALAQRYPQITSISLHPGGVKTGVWGGDKNVNWLLYNLVIKPMVNLTGVSPKEGAKTQLWCSFSKDVQNGRYYEPLGKAGKEGKLSYDDVLSAELWKWTEKELLSHGSPGWQAT
jgi:NAD(P)-dependent dehydrogenase (short-subunit alcohol dehydrogenase family)